MLRAAEQELRKRSTSNVEMEMRKFMGDDCERVFR